MTPPFGNTVFCDDIRQEINGKVSYIGCYMGELRSLTPFPITIPKLGFGITLYLPPDAPANGLTLRIFLPGDDEGQPSIEGEIDIATIRDEARSQLLATGSEEGPLHRLTQHVLLSPVEIKQPGHIKVRAAFKDDVVKLGTLKIVGPPAAPQ